MLVAAIVLIAAAPAHAASDRVAALQVALRAHAGYAGAVDGAAGPATTAASAALQARSGLAVDGVVGPNTRRALGRLGRHPVGSRPLHGGLVGWDVAALQFALETHGFPLGTVDGGFGAQTSRRCAASRRSRDWAPTASPAPPRCARCRARPRAGPRCGGRSASRSATATARAATAFTPGSTSPPPPARRSPPRPRAG